MSAYDDRRNETINYYLNYRNALHVYSNWDPYRWKDSHYYIEKAYEDFFKKT